LFIRYERQWKVESGKWKEKTKNKEKTKAV